MTVLGGIRIQKNHPSTQNGLLGKLGVSCDCYVSIYLGGWTFCMPNRKRNRATSILSWDLVNSYVTCGSFG